MGDYSETAPSGKKIVISIDVIIITFKCMLCVSHSFIAQIRSREEVDVHDYTQPYEQPARSVV